MKTIQNMPSQTSKKQRAVALLLSTFLLCTLLLSACDFPGNGSASTTHATNTPTMTPTPTIDTTLSNQGATQLKAFQQQIALIKQYGGDTTTYQQQYDADQQALQTAKTDAAYKAALTTLNGHVNTIQLPALKTESAGLLKQLNQEVASWGQQHKYHDASNNTDYALGYEYGPNGMGGWAQDELNVAKTHDDYQQTVDDLNMYLTNFHAMTTNSSDKTPYNQVHQTDIQLMQHYSNINKRVVIVSLEEQAMRVYDNGKLVKSFLVTTGRPNKPTLAGVWWVEGKQSPTVFKSGVPKSSPDYYPDTPINFAMQYHSEGYFIHDSWWRDNYGPGTNYPHADDSGDPFSSQGSHGCVNMAKNDAGWLYGFVKLYTPIMIY
jgi:lipoprotein-anchoring transpeptidase ErfK/SrfK